MLNYEKYNEKQLLQITLGSERGLDTSLYQSFRYDWRQMEQIRLGLETGLDVSKYRPLNYGWREMYEIRLALEDGLDDIPIDSRYNHNQLAEIANWLREGLDISKLSYKIPAECMKELRLALDDGLDMSNFYGIDDIYIVQTIRTTYNTHRWSSKETIIKLFENNRYDRFQVMEICLGIYQYLDISKFSDPELDWEIMHNIRLSLILCK